MGTQRADIISKLQREILHLEGYKPSNGNAVDVGLGPITYGLPNRSFPLGAVHEFVSQDYQGLAATSAFIAGVLSPLMSSGGISLWIGSARKLFPPALNSFGIQPDRVIFIDVQKEREVLWAVEEALKCPALTAVVGEMKTLGFTSSRRLQLAVEQSKVTGFIIRNHVENLNATACVSRWRITPLASHSPEELPGVGFPVWKVELMRIRNGRTGIWEVKWANNRFIATEVPVSAISERKKQTA
jgi:protein ImuA